MFPSSCKIRWIYSRLLLASVWLGVAVAEESSFYPCRYCPFDYRVQGWLETGGTFLSDEDYYFATFSGYQERGFYPLLQGEYQQRRENGHFWFLSFSRDHPDSWGLQFEQGVQGRYQWQFSIDQFPAWSSAAFSPFLSTDANHLELPLDWVAAETTAEMALRQTPDFSLKTRHQKAFLNFEYKQQDNWRTGFQIHRQQTQGAALLGASILTTSSLLPAPRQSTTNALDAYIAYIQTGWQLKMAYALSLFNNENTTLSWQNPFVEIMPGSGHGQMSLEPDNRFHQVTLSFNYWFDRAQLSMSSGFGQGKQDDDFAPVTVNPLLIAESLSEGGTLSKDSLDGQVNTQNWRVRLTAQPGQDWRLTTSYRFDLRDNKTRRSIYPQVVTDSFIAASRANTPYDFQRQQGEVKLSWQPDPLFKIHAAVEQDNMQRRHQEKNKTGENTQWLEVVINPLRYFDVKVKVKGKNRDGHDPVVVDPLSAEDGNIIQRFHTADLRRREIRAESGFYPLEWMSFALSFSQQKDDFTRTQYGLKAGENSIRSVDVSLTPEGDYAYFLFYSREKQHSLQTGLEDYSNIDWFANNQDLVATYGANLVYLHPEVAWQIKARLLLSDFAGDTQVALLGNEPAFPRLLRRLTRLELDASYPLNEKTALKLAYIGENYHSSDWQQDFSLLDKVPRLVSAGQTPPNYRIHLVALTLNHEF